MPYAVGLSLAFSTGTDTCFTERKRRYRCVGSLTKMRQLGRGKSQVQNPRFSDMQAWLMSFSPTPHCFSWQEELWPWHLALTLKTQYPSLEQVHWLLIQGLRVLLCLYLAVQSCLTHCNPMDCSLPGSSVQGILQARILEWVAMPSSRGSSQPRYQTQVSHLAGRFFPLWSPREAHEYWSGLPIPSPGDLPNPGIKLGSHAL